MTDNTEQQATIDLNDSQYRLNTISDPVEKFNMFIKKWCPDYAHLIDSDQNDGEEIRQMLRAEQQAVGGEEAFSSVIQEIGDVCHESYTGCQKTDRLVKEYDYCYTDEIINLLDNPRVKAAISRHYIAKEAVAQLFGRVKNGEYKPELSTIEVIDQEIAALNLDSDTDAKTFTCTCPMCEFHISARKLDSGTSREDYDG
jgi:hypothetical protein